MDSRQETATRWRHVPISVLGQLITTAMIALLLAFALLIAANRFGAFDRLLQSPTRIFEGRVAALVDALTSSAFESRAKARALAERTLPGTILLDPQGPRGEENTIAQLNQAQQSGVSFALSTQRSIEVPATAGNNGSRLLVSLPDGGLLSVPVPTEALSSSFGPFLWLLSSLVIASLAAATWVVTQIRNPLRRIASAFASFDARQNWVRLPETGPCEIRDLTAQLNGMADRTAALMRERAVVIGAINHDLRLPVTRLRLLAEEIEDVELRRRNLANLKSMDVMLHASLDYLKHGRPLPKLCSVDLVALLRTVSDEFADMGFDVAYGGPNHLKLHCDPDLIERALNNLVDNATRYALTVRLSAGLAADGKVSIKVVDDGPGLSDADKKRALAPFDTAKAAEKHGGSPVGFGLGLAIVKMIAEVHDGWLDLSDAKPCGLTATITVPCER
ncbi:HAMP domain-containing sensor histidine kinase [Bosea sp. OK403]|uniref:sensor histidine kinase n=1 Tax=Bosea sp. OK403 TaxID=1855286 RepID=UPI00158753B1|nr:HAMP domain-containing sensor histidine kinase [Bosea sp. OK403]